jgi:taurine dioxygenase
MATTTTPTSGGKPSAFRLPGYPIAVGPFTHLAAERDRLAALRWRHFEACQLGSTVGAEISGLDLTLEQPDEVIAELRQALYDYKVIFFRNQPLSPAQHVAFARRFGELEVHPFLPSNTGEPELVRFEKTAEVSGYENSWHHDVTWRACPSMGAVLHALSVPDHGGDTLFADMYAAYDALDETTKVEIDELIAVHDFTQTFGHQMTKDEREKAQEQYPRVEHPVVCSHPGTGKLHLYVNRPFVNHIKGLDPEASRELLDRLCRQADTPEHQCRFTWSVDAVAFWDNRAVQHYASSDYWPHRRTMERASIIGTRPSRG